MATLLSSFMPGVKVKNQIGRILTVYSANPFQVFVREEPDNWYHPSKLTVVEPGPEPSAVLTHSEWKERLSVARLNETDLRLLAIIAATGAAHPSDATMSAYKLRDAGLIRMSRKGWVVTTA